MSNIQSIYLIKLVHIFRWNAKILASHKKQSPEEKGGGYCPIAFISVGSLYTLGFISFNCPTLTLHQPFLPLIPPSDIKADRDKPNFKLDCQTEGERRALEGERNAEGSKKSLPPLALSLFL